MKTPTIAAASLLFLTASLAGAALVGCGDDTQGLAPDSGHVSEGGNGGDGGLTDVQQPDAPPGNAGGDAGGGDAGEGGDGACNYAAFVLGLIANHTNGTDPPSTDLGQNCVDDQNQTEFQSLFP